MKAEDQHRMYQISTQIFKTAEKCPFTKKQKRTWFFTCQVEEIQCAFLVFLPLNVSSFSCPFLQHPRPLAVFRREISELKMQDFLVDSFPWMQERNTYPTVYLPTPAHTHTHAHIQTRVDKERASPCEYITPARGYLLLSSKLLLISSWERQALQRGRWYLGPAVPSTQNMEDLVPFVLSFRPLLMSTFLGQLPRKHSIQHLAPSQCISIRNNLNANL